MPLPFAARASHKVADDSIALRRTPVACRRCRSGASTRCPLASVTDQAPWGVGAGSMASSCHCSVGVILVLMRGAYRINPEKEYKIRKDDEVIVLAEASVKVPSVRVEAGGSAFGELQAPGPPFRG